jgi:3-oxoacyl-[acyl-carrier protein] reductase
MEVVGCSRGTEDSLQAPNYTHYRVDITSEPEVVQLFRQIRARFGRLDVAINNAAVKPAIALSLMTSHEAAAKTLVTNVLGTFVVSREAAKIMMRRKWGRIINFSSMAARHEVEGEAIYAASKAAIQSITRVMAKEFFRYGITCNVVAPSAVETDMAAAVSATALQEILARNAIPEKGAMSDISNTIDWLIKPESQAITGQLIFLGGA